MTNTQLWLKNATDGYSFHCVVFMRSRIFCHGRDQILITKELVNVCGSFTNSSKIRQNSEKKQAHTLH